MDLGRIKADMKEGTELYSVDKGQNAECEIMLNMTADAGTIVIGFRKGNKTYRQMQKEFSQQNLKEFIAEVQINSWMGSKKPEGGFKLIPNDD